LQQSVALGLKRQIREERTVNKILSAEIDSLSKSIRITKSEELEQEIKVY